MSLSQAAAYLWPASTYERIPTRPAHALNPTLLSRCGVAWLGGGRDTVHKPKAGKLGLETNTSSSALLQQPVSASHASIRAVPASPGLLLSTRCGPVAPGLSLQLLLPSKLTPLPHLSVQYSVEPVIRPRRFVSQILLLLQYILVTVSLQEPEPTSHACMHASVLRSPTPTSYSNIALQMPAEPLVRHSI